MKCKVDINGNLIVEAESEVEAFALLSFWEDYDSNRAEVRIVVKPAGAAWEPPHNIYMIQNNALG